MVKTTLCRTLTVLPPKQLDRIHEASLSILAETGVNVHSEQVRDLMAGAGAKVENNLRTYIPAELVDKALDSAPSRIDVYDRNGHRSMCLEGTNCYFGTGSDLEFTVSCQSEKRLKSTLRDAELSARICERLKNIDFVMSFALPEEAAASRCAIEQFRVMLENTSKPIVMTVFSGPDTFEQMHELACQSCGGPDKFRQSPNYIMYGQFVSPLQHNTEALDRLMYCADNHIPVVYVATIMMGASGPVSLAGALALANAECLAGLVMHQLRSPGAPFIYGGCVSPLDMKTTVFAYGSPEWRLTDTALSQLSQFYNLPVFGTAGATDAQVIDAQAGAEWAYSLLACALSGVNLIHDIGYMESGLTGSLKSLVICDEIIGMVRQFMQGITVTEDALALDVIKQVGPAGHFFSESHTLENFRRDVWYPSLFSRHRFDNWKSKGGKDVLQRAADRIAELLAD